MGDVTTADCLDLLGDVVARLQGDVTELQGRWEALGKELEAKRQRLELAVEMKQRPQGEEASSKHEGGAAVGGVLLGAGHEDDASQTAQASGELLPPSIPCPPALFLCPRILCCSVTHRHTVSSWP
jgi:hypothetical protein